MSMLRAPVSVVSANPAADEHASANHLKQLYHKLLGLPIPYDAKIPPLAAGVTVPLCRQQWALWLCYGALAAALGERYVFNSFARRDFNRLYGSWLVQISLCADLQYVCTESFANFQSQRASWLV
jgi:hypothetical protein